MIGSRIAIRLSPQDEFMTQFNEIPDLKRPMLVRKIEQLDNHTFGVEWTDGEYGKWRLADLQRACPCANCVDEWTGERTLDPAKVDDTVRATSIESVGRYALRVNFTKGCREGIYTFHYLREICQDRTRKSDSN